MIKRYDIVKFKLRQPHGHQFGIVFGYIKDSYRVWRERGIFKHTFVTADQVEVIAHVTRFNLPLDQTFWKQFEGEPLPGELTDDPDLEKLLPYLP